MNIFIKIEYNYILIIYNVYTIIFTVKLIREYNTQGRGDAAAGSEAFLDGVKRRGADIAINDADGTQAQGCKAAGAGFDG
jgi:hypothetical protein